MTPVMPLFMAAVLFALFAPKNDRRAWAVLIAWFALYMAYFYIKH